VALSLAKKASEALGAGKVTVFKNFGTAMFRYRDWEVEFVGARKNRMSAEAVIPL